MEEVSGCPALTQTSCLPHSAGILLYVLDSGSGGDLNKSSWVRRREEREKKELEEREQEKKKEEEMKKTGVADSYTSNITPSTAFQIRNRFLSRVGTKAC